MRRGPAGGIDAGVYVRALPLLARNPSIIVVPLMTAVVSILLDQVLTPLGGSTTGQLTLGLARFVERVLLLFGLGAACIIADDAWRHGRASFDQGWTEARRRGSELLMAAVGFAFVLGLASYAGLLFGFLIANLLNIVVVVLFIWTMPAAAVGGIPGGAALSVSVERVRANPIPAVICAAIAILLFGFAVPIAADYLLFWIAPYLGSLTIAGRLIEAVLQSIAVAYLALIITKTYADAAFGRRW